MPRSKAGGGTAEAGPTVEIPSALLDELVKGPMSAAAVQAALSCPQFRRHLS